MTGMAGNSRRSSQAEDSRAGLLSSRRKPMSPDLASPLSHNESQHAVPAAGLLSVGHAVPPHRMLQSDAAAAARRIFAQRYAAYLEGAQALFIDAASRALANAGCEGRDVDTIVTVSSTGIATPSLEA